MQKTPYYSYKLGTLPKGCQLCVKGSKLVLFVTGLCPRSCYYCPISDKKYKKDLTYADEWPTKKIKDIIKEARLIDAKGAGFTGGDPLCSLDRTIIYLKKLKKEFGKKFHVHLYTSFDLANKNNLKKLYKAGLDEIRFHPDLDNAMLWNNIELAQRYSWEIGIEIPVIPKKEKQTMKLIDYFADKIDFLNLNELEMADNKVNKLFEMGCRVKNKMSYATKGSEELAFRLLRHISKKYPGLDVHYCTAKLKDKVQLANRIRRRAKNAAKPCDIITPEGLLYRGAVYSDKDLEKLRKKLMKDYKIPAELLEKDVKRKRILIAPWVIDRIKDKKLRLALVEEYPTYDCFNISTEFL